MTQINNDDEGQQPDVDNEDDGLSSDGDHMEDENYNDHGLNELL